MVIVGAALQWCKCLRDWNCIQGLGLGAWFVTYSFYNNDYKSDTEMFVCLFIFLFLWNLLCSRSFCHRITKASDSTPHSPSQKDNCMHAQLHLLKIYSSYGSEWLEHVGQNYLESSPGKKVFVPTFRFSVERWKDAEQTTYRLSPWVSQLFSA